MKKLLMQKKYYVIGLVIISLLVILGLSRIAYAKNDGFKGFVQRNFPHILKVLVANEEPIDVNVTNQSQQAEIPQPPYDVNVNNFPSSQDVNVKNFPSSQDVTVGNTEPIDVNIANFPDIPAATNPKLITLYENAAFGNSSDIPGIPFPNPAPVVFDVSGYSKLVIHNYGQTQYLLYKLQTSTDGENWQNQEKPSYTFEGSSEVYPFHEFTDYPQVYDIIGPKYKLEVVPYYGTCYEVTIKAYLLP